MGRGFNFGRDYKLRDLEYMQYALPKLTWNITERPPMRTVVSRNILWEYRGFLGGIYAINHFYPLYIFVHPIYTPNAKPSTLALERTEGSSLMVLCSIGKRLLVLGLDGIKLGTATRGEFPTGVSEIGCHQTLESLTPETVGRK